MLLCGFSLAWAFAAAASKIEKPLPSADAIFVFSGSAEYKSRAGKAAELFRQGRAPKIVLTDDKQQGGWSKSEERNPFFWELARGELIKNQVPAAAIEVLPDAVVSTHNEAVLLIKQIKKNDWQKVLLVTSDFHTRRALRTVERAAAAENLNVRIGIAAADSSGASTTKRWRRAGEEIIKSIYYQLFY